MLKLEKVGKVQDIGHLLKSETSDGMAKPTCKQGEPQGAELQ